MIHPVVDILAGLTLMLLLDTFIVIIARASRAARG
jgi:hypothetical protein